MQNRNKRKALALKQRETLSNSERWLHCRFDRWYARILVPDCFRGAVFGRSDVFRLSKKGCNELRNTYEK